MQNFAAALFMLCLFSKPAITSAQLKPTKRPHVFTYSTSFPKLDGWHTYDFDRSYVISDSLFGIFHFARVSDNPDTLRIENIYTREVVDRIEMPASDNFEMIHPTRTGQDLFFMRRNQSDVKLTGTVAERWAKKHGFKSSAFPVCFRYNRLTKQRTTITINTKPFKSYSNDVSFRLSEVVFDSVLYAFYLSDIANLLTLKIDLKKGETIILTQADRKPLGIRHSFYKDPSTIIETKVFDLRMRGQALVNDANNTTIDTLQFDQQIQQKLLFPSFTLLLLDQDVPSDLAYKTESVRLKPQKAPTSEPISISTPPQSFPYSQRMFTQWILRYQKDRDDLFRGYDHYLDCKANSRYPGSCYLPLGGEGRATNLLTDCQELMELLEKFPSEVTSYITTDAATTKQGFEFDKTKFRALLKEYK